MCANAVRRPIFKRPTKKSKEQQISENGKAIQFSLKSLAFVSFENISLAKRQGGLAVG